MNCIVTGHTSGIGKIIYEHFLSKNWTVIGMSRSNGYDITKDQDKIVSESTDCDIFVNCAYDGDSQLQLLNKLHNKVKNIIVIGSVAADYAKVWKSYGLDKFHLQERCKELAEEESSTNIFYLKLSFCENATLPVFVNDKYKASFDELLQIIDLWLKVPKIYSVEFILKKTPEIMEFARKMNPHN